MPTAALEYDALQRYAVSQDPDAFAILVERYQQMVYAICLRKLGNEADARDAAQDTFIKLAKSASTVHESLAGWLHRCATTTSIDHIRKDSRRRAREAVAASNHDATSSHDPEWSEVRRMLDEAIDELPADPRDLIVQRYLAGKSNIEIAQEVGISDSLVSRRVNAAVDQLRRCLHAKGLGVGVAALVNGLKTESAIALPAGLTCGGAASGGASMCSQSWSTQFASWWASGAKIKLSTAALGSLGVHAALVAGYLLCFPSGVTGPVSPMNLRQPDGQSPAGEAPTRNARLISVADVDSRPPTATADTETPASPRMLVHLSGDVQRPGDYTLPLGDRLSLLQLIVSGGGVTADAPAKALVKLSRTEDDGRERIVFEGTYAQLNLGGRELIYLRAQDRVEVGSGETNELDDQQQQPVKDMVSISGRVKRPGDYVFPSTEPLTLLQLIDSAGGVTIEDPANTLVTLSRRNEKGEQVSRVQPLTILLADDQPPMFLAANDIIMVEIERVEENDPTQGKLRPSTSPPSQGGYSQTVEGPKGYAKIRNYDVASLAGMAYEMPSAYRMSWEIETPPGRFDINLSGPEWRIELQEILKREFGIVGRADTQSFETFAIRVPENAEHRLVENNGSSRVSGRPGMTQWTASWVHELASTLERRLNTPVVDQSQLTGRYDFTLKLTFPAEPEAVTQVLQRDMGLEFVALGKQEWPVVIMERSP